MRRARRLLLIGFLALLLACPLAAAISVQQRDLGVSPIDFGVAGYRLIGYTTRLPACSPEGPCQQSMAMTIDSRGDYFVVWLLYPLDVGAARMVAGKRLLTIPLFR